MVSTLQKLLRSTSLNSDDPNPPSQPRLSEAGSANLLKQSSLPSRGSFNDFSVGCGEDAQESLGQPRHSLPPLATGSLPSVWRRWSTDSAGVGWGSPMSTSSAGSQQEGAPEADNGRGVAIPQAQKAHYNPFAAAVSTEQQRKPLKHQGKRIDGLDHYEWVQLVSPGSL
eukprot:jgi/Astpho2/6007/Aster-03964